MIRTVDNLIEWLENNLDNPIYLWSLENDKVEVLGFFLFYPHKDPFGTYVVKLTSKHCNIHCLAIVPRDHDSTYVCHLISKPQWRFWNPEDSRNPLYAGDNPEKYKELRDAAQKLHKAKKDTGTDTPSDRG